MAKNMLGIDPKKFKVLRSDDKSTTLKHQDGHELTIAHNVLAKHNQEILKSLAKSAATPEQAEEARNQKGFAKGGNIPNESGFMPTSVTGYAKGGKADLKEHMQSVNDQQQMLAKKHFKAPSEEALKQGKTVFDQADQFIKGQPKKMADGGSTDTKVQVVRPDDTSTPQQKMRNVKQNFEQSGGGKPPSDSPLNTGDWSGLNPFKAEGGPVADIGDVKGAMSRQPTQADPDQDLFNQTYTDSKARSEGMAPIANALGMNWNPEINANKEALDAVAIQKEKRTEQEADVAKTNAQINQINQQRQALGLPPVPGTVSSSIPDLVSPDQNVELNAKTDQPQMTEMADKAPGSQSLPEPQAKGQPGINDYEGLIGQGLQQERQGASMKAQAISNLGEQQAQAYQKQANALAQAQSAYKANYDQLNNERLAHIKDVQNGYIDPNAYWKDHSKIATGIGIILAGFNPTNNPNGAVNFLKFQMEQSLDAQSKNLQAKNNLLSANLHQFGNLRDAQDMTRLMMADQLKSQIEQTAAKAAGPLAKAQAASAIGEIDKAYAPLSMQLAMRRALMGLGSNGGSPQSVEQVMQWMDVNNPGSSKSYRERYVPGFVGTQGGAFASVPIPDAARNSLSSFQNVDRLITEAQSLAKKPWTSMNPQERARGATLMGELQSQIRTAEDQGVYKESEAKFMNNLLGGNPASALAAVTSTPKLNEMQKIKKAEYLQKASQYGLKPQASQNSQSHMSIQEGTKAQSKSGKPMVYRNGSWVYGQ